MYFPSFVFLWWRLQHSSWNVRYFLVYVVGFLEYYFEKWHRANREYRFANYLIVKYKCVQPGFIYKKYMSGLVEYISDWKKANLLTKLLKFQYPTVIEVHWGRSQTFGEELSGGFATVIAMLSVGWDEAWFSSVCTKRTVLVPWVGICLLSNGA